VRSVEFPMAGPPHTNPSPKGFGEGRVGLEPSRQKVENKRLKRTDRLFLFL